MNTYIKTKLIEQMGILGKAQEMALSQNSPSTTASITMGVLDYIKILNDLDDEDNDYTCPNCQKAEHKAMLRQDIANACDLPIELVDRVLAGQDEVLGMDD
jgi:Asp-tRNA(Asn)/Glu-tRNA(Gln) amidotransferase C subunit